MAPITQLHIHDIMETALHVLFLYLGLHYQKVPKFKLCTTQARSIYTRLGSPHIQIQVKNQIGTKLKVIEDPTFLKHLAYTIKCNFILGKCQNRETKIVAYKKGRTKPKMICLQK